MLVSIQGFDLHRILIDYVIHADSDVVKASFSRMRLLLMNHHWRSLKMFQILSLVSLSIHIL